MKLSQSVLRLGTETAFEVLATAKKLEQKGKKIIHLEIGEPDFTTPKNICESAKKAIDDGWTHYGPSAGLSETRATIAEIVGKTRNIKVDPEEVVVTPGAKPIIFFSILAIVDQDDEVIYPNPGFPIYESVINFVGARAVPLRLLEENNFSLDVSELKKLVNQKTKLIILNSPANPTGGVVSLKDLEEIAKIIFNYPDVIVLSDEVYSSIIYEDKHYSLASLPKMKERVIIIDGFSKTYAMTGWRLGYGVLNKKLAEYITKLQTNSNSCPTTFIQISAIEALKGPQDWVKGMVREFQRRRDVIVKGLNEIPGFKCLTPKGAFYAFPNIKKTAKTSKQLADELLQNADVAVLSGTAFGSYGEGYLRFSYANSVENIQLAISKIKEYIKTIL